MKLTKNIEHISRLIKEGKFQNALDYIHSKRTDTKLEEIEDLSYDIKIGEILRQKGEFHNLIKYSKRIQKKSNQLNEKIFEIHGLLFEIFANYRLNNQTYVTKLINKTEQLIENCDETIIEPLLIRLLAYKSFVLSALGDFKSSKETAIRCYEQSLEYNEPELISYSLYVYGIISFQIGELDDALESFMKSLEKGKDLISLYDTGNVFFGLGYVYKNKGNLEKAFEKFKR